ncbi:MAG: hypothetical protein JJT77_04425 [Crocinitomicaceae bacterium]|nr:hypothetical protein [Crocinitomicaceae bacterium]
MLSTLFKKKLSDDQLATIFVNGVLDAIDNGFQEVMSLVKEDPAFDRQPQTEHLKDGHFSMIVIVANVSMLVNSFESQQVSSLEELIKENLANVYGMDKMEFNNYFSSYSSFMSRVNHPSKNMLYAMSKAFFYKYQLNEYQDDYFRELSSPNPLFLKRMDEVMENFIWNWDAFFKKYKLI